MGYAQFPPQSGSCALAPIEYGGCIGYLTPPHKIYHILGNSATGIPKCARIVVWFWETAELSSI